ncbi:MAG: amidohydrolase family protein [Pseudomonadota bacterium]
MNTSHSIGTDQILPLPALDDIADDFLPQGLPPVVDAHVHIFPDRIFSAVREWFDENGWPIRYRMAAHDTLAFLLERGVAHVVALQYAHRPGVAGMLNPFMTRICERFDRVTGLATVFPGEPDAAGILETAFEQGLSGVKLHAHVQCFSIDGPDMATIYDVCQANDMPLVMHVGREPKSDAYRCDPYELCRVDLVEAVLRRYPRLKLCVPHLGADEFTAYHRLLSEYDNLWLDTTMVLADYLPIGTELPPLADFRSDRVMFGTDFPNIPYAWDREIKKLAAMGIDASFLARLLGENAAAFYGISQF